MELNNISIFNIKLHEFWYTGVELEDTFSTIPPHERHWYQKWYLWYRRHFWYILALGGTILLAILMWDMRNSNNKGKKQLGGFSNPLSKRGQEAASSIVAGVKAAPGAIKAGVKAAPGAAYAGAKAGVKGAYAGAAAAADRFRNASSMIYKWLFTIFIFVAVGIFIMPTVAMIIIGFITFYIARGSLQRTVAM